MLTDFDANQVYITVALEQKGMVMTSTAMRPLRSVPFERLHEILDHEEAFLRQRFVEAIVDAHTVRTKESGGTDRVNAQDVRTAMLMLGRAVAEAPSEAFASKSVIKDICPYCS